MRIVSCTTNPAQFHDARFDDDDVQGAGGVRASDRQQLAGGEEIHQSAIDRRKLPGCGYDPRNLEECLGRGGAPPVMNTKRIARGEA